MVAQHLLLLTTALLALTSTSTACLPPTQTIKVTSDDSSFPLSFFEISVFDSNGRNIAGQAKPSASSTYYSSSPLLAVDKDSSTYFTSKEDDTDAPWYQLSFDIEENLDRIVILNKWCEDINDSLGCLCHLSNAHITLYDGNGSERLFKNLGEDTCGVLELELNANEFEDTFQNYNWECGETILPTVDTAQQLPEIAKDNYYMQHVDIIGNNSNPLTKQEALQLVQVLQKESSGIPHQCNVAVTRDVSDNYEKHPVIFCNFYNIPIGLYTTANIQSASCSDNNDFLQKSNNSSRGEVYSHGVASAVLVPDVTEEDRMLDVYNTTYCARIDVYYDDESIYTDTFDLDITYRNYEVDGKYGIAASLNEGHGDSTASAWSVDGGQIGLGIMFGFIFGGILTMTVLAMLNKKKERQGNNDGNNEIDSLTNENGGAPASVFTLT